MLRFIIDISLVVGFLVLSIPALIVEWLIGKVNPSFKDRSSLHIIQWIFNIILKVAGVDVTVIGRENIPRDVPVLYASNHRSFFDILLTYVLVPDVCGYISKYELIQVPLLSNWMRNLHCLFLDRDDLKQGMKTILEAIDKIKQGISVCVFPEGTRNKGKELELLPFHEGSFRIASKTDCPVVPIAISNSSAMWEDHLPCVRPCHVTIEYCQPIDVSQLSREEKKHIGTLTQERILEALIKNQQ